jgi:hypothetical protein
MSSRYAFLLTFGILFLATACGSPNEARQAAPLETTEKPLAPAPTDDTNKSPISATKNSKSDASVQPPSAHPAKTHMARAPEATPPPKKKPPPSPDRLLGMNDAAVTGLLGAAKLVRRDGDAQIWQYRNDHCVLDVFLYGPGPLSVAHVDLRKRRRGTQDKAACYAELAGKATSGS